MKKIIQILVSLYPDYLTKKIRGGINYLRSMKVSYKLKKCGKNFYIRFPALNIKGEKYIEIGNNFRAGKDLLLTAWDKYENDTFDPKIIIGNDCLIGEYSQITAINSIEIGNNLLTGKNIFISDHNHGKVNFDEKDIPPIKRSLYSSGKVIIGNNVWLGNNVCVLAGVTLGDNVTVGANSVVTKSFPNNCVIGGIPAKIIKRIDGELSEE